MGRNRTLRVVGSAAVLLLSSATPAGAHSLHGDVDAPLPFAAYLAGAAIAVALSFVFVAFGDDRPAPEARRLAGRARLWRPVRWSLRLVGLLAWLWVVAQTIAGGTSDAEVASLVLWVYGWIGLAMVERPAGSGLGLARPLHHALRPRRRDLPADWPAPPWPRSLARSHAGLAGGPADGLLRVARAGWTDRQRTRAGCGPRGLHPLHARGHGLVWQAPLARARRGLQRLVRPARPAGALWPRGTASRGPGAAAPLRPCPDPRTVVRLAVDGGGGGAGSVIWDGSRRRSRSTTSSATCTRSPKRSCCSASWPSWSPSSSASGGAWATWPMGAGLVPVAVGYIVGPLPDLPAD